MTMRQRLQRLQRMKLILEISSRDLLDLELITPGFPPTQHFSFSLTGTLDKLKEKSSRKWRKWFPPKPIEYIEEIYTDATPYGRAMLALISKDVTVLDYIWVGKFASKDRKGSGPASKTEVKRWCDNGNIWMNGKAVGWADKVEWPVESCILFPKGDRITFI